MKEKKGAVDEGGVRSPCCIRWPGRITPGIVNEQLTGAIDLLPTLLGLSKVGYTTREPLDGIDLSHQFLHAEESELDRVPREESYVKGFKPYSMGKIHLDQGRVGLTLQATSIANEEVMNFWLLELKRVE